MGEQQPQWDGCRRLTSVCGTANVPANVTASSAESTNVLL